MFRTMVGSAVASIAILLLPSVSSAGSDPFLQGEMDNLVQAGYPGAAIDDSGSTAASGVADVVSGQAMQPNQSVRIGSLTKTFVATVALQLVREGRLSLDDTVERWEPGLLPYGDQVTVRMLLNHTSGVPDYYEKGSNPLLFQFINDPGFRTITWTPQQLVALVSNQPPTFHPGAQSEYSDTNYVIAGMIIETVTGDTIGNEIRNRIIAPLHLKHTMFPTADQTTLPSPSGRGYSFLVDRNDNPIPGTLTDETEYNTSLMWAMGAMVSNLSDLNTFYHALFSGQLLPANMLAQMVQTVPVHEPDFPPQGVGFGLGIWSWQLPCGTTVWGHEGEVPGFNTWSFSTADGSRTVSMVTNQLLATPAMFGTEFANYAAVWCH
jgi:D-alanyl-D-alanine carboxypeptidase